MRRVTADRCLLLVANSSCGCRFSPRRLRCILRFRHRAFTACVASRCSVKAHAAVDGRAGAGLRCSSSSRSGFPDDQHPGTAVTSDSQLTIPGLRPSPAFLARLSATGRNHVAKIVSELELYAHMSDEVPQAMDDRDWEQFARAPNVLRRVNLLRYLAAKEISMERKSRADQATAEFNDEMTRLAAAKFADGEMVYWPGFHELIRSPAFYQKAMNHVSGSRMWASMRDGLLPAVLIDMQCFERARDDERNLLGRQVIRAIQDCVLQHNYLHRIPLPLTIADYDTSKPGATKLNEMHCFPFTGDCDREAFMPTYTAQSVVELYSNRQRDVIYITPYATVAFAGPLNEADVYVVLATKNRHNETLAVCRRECFRARRLPIAEHFSWRQGTSQNLPIDVTLRILHEVALNGGDWKTAMLNNITRRNLLPEEERSEEERAVSFLRREKWKQKQEIIARLKQFSQES